MSAPTAHSSGFRYSLRHFLLLIAALAVALAALKFANEWWLSAIGASAMLLAMAMVVVALIDCGPRQAFAIGFVACAALYGVVLLACGNNEFDPYDGKLPTTRILRPVFEAFSEPTYLPAGQFGAAGVRKSQLPDNVEIVEAGSYYPGDAVMITGTPATTSAGKSIYRRAGEFPQRERFFPVAHVLWGLLLGYVGGHFARFVYARRMRDGAAAETELR